jgi:voltage-gated potassium channel
MGLDVTMEQVRVEPHTEFASKTLGQLLARRELDVIVLAVRKSDGQMIFNPHPETEIAGGDFLIVMGKPPNLQNLEDLLTKSQKPAR